MSEEMAAVDIDSNGVWNSGKRRVDLLTAKLPIPEKIIVVNDEEACLFLVQANEYIEFCPECRNKLDDDIILLVLETVRLLPAKCCNRMMWFVE